MDIAKAFGKYTLHERVAVGGMAEVYRATARLQAGDEPVVIKTILPQHAGDPYFREQFHKEALVVAQLHHPNVIRLFDYGQHAGVLFLAFEAVDGADLGRLLNRARALHATLPAALALEVARQVAGALAYIHSRTSPSGLALNLVHRDISPHNLLVGLDGTVKLADFGIAKSAAQDSATATGDVKGKAAYMAPEQAAGRGEVDARADLYAFGGVLFELFCGERVASASDRDARLRSLALPGALPSPTERDPLLHALLPVIGRCLAHDPAERFASADEILAALEPLDSEATGAKARLGAWVTETLRRASAGPTDENVVRDLLGLPDRSSRTTAPACGPLALPGANARGLRGRRLVVGLAVAVVAAALSALVLQAARPRHSEPTTAVVAKRGPPTAPRRTALLQTIAAPPQPSSKAGAQPRPGPRRGPVVGPRGYLPIRGYLTINSIPWATVYVDGRRRGVTPLRRLTLAPGTRSVVLRDRRGRLLRRYTALISPGQVSLLSFDASRRTR